jgi:outer membrane protein assembly factor BamA
VPVTGEELRVAAPRPDPAALERSGAIIGSIRFEIIDVFDTSNPKENKTAFRFVNSLHIKSREETIRRRLLFAVGEPFVQARLEETERSLRALGFLQDASVVAESYENGMVGVLVRTRDSWTTKLGIRFGYAGGKSQTGMSLTEVNFLGRGKTLGIDFKNTIDRTTTRLLYEDFNLLGTNLHLATSYQSATDGHGWWVRFEDPFYSLDDRRTWGIDARNTSSRMSWYQEGDIFQRFDQNVSDVAVWYGFSEGLKGRTTNRWMFGYEYQKEAFEPSYALPPGYPQEGIPRSATDSGPTVEYDLVRSDYIKVRYFQRFSRFEDFNLGTTLSLWWQLAPRALGSSQDEIIGKGIATRGFRTGRSGTLLASAAFQTRLGERDETGLGFEATHYLTAWPHQTFVVKLGGDTGFSLDANDRYLLGGDNGLRGFSARRFDGDHRIFLNVEDRVHSERLLFQLLQPGFAVFVDAGNAWGGPRSREVCVTNTDGTRSCHVESEYDSFGNLKVDVGVSLLLDVIRSAHSSFVRMSVAWPVNGGKYDQARFLFSFGKEGGF